MPKISCLMSTRNRDNMIGESVKSIIDQTFNDWELIIIDDHSDEDDRTESIVSSFNDSRIRYYKLFDDQGRGLPAGRNFATMLARGEFMAIADSDDINYPLRFERSIQEFTKHDPDLIYGNIDCWDPKANKIFPREDRHRVREFNLREFIEADFIPNPTIMYKKSIAYAFPYNSFFHKAEDYDFLSRLSEYGFKFSYISESLVKYRVHEGSISSQDSKGIKYSKIVRENRKWQTK